MQARYRYRPFSVPQLVMAMAHCYLKIGQAQYVDEAEVFHTLGQRIHQNVHKTLVPLLSPFIKYNPAFFWNLIEVMTPETGI